LGLGVFAYISSFQKRAYIILKLDFEKVFDKIEHEAMLNITRHKGFGQKMVVLDETNFLFWHLLYPSKWFSKKNLLLQKRGKARGPSLSLPYFLCWMLTFYKV